MATTAAMEVDQAPVAIAVDVDTPPDARDHHNKNDELPVAPSSASARVLTPPTSEDMDKRDELDTSDLSELELEDENEDDDDIGDIQPDHYFGDGKIPVFKPTMAQFRDFKKYVDKIDKFGMKSGIVKVVAPMEWRDSLPDLTESVKTIKVKNPITQEFAGTHGKYTQANIEKQRSYNLPQWKALTEESNHQPPARRGERRRAAESTPKTTTPRTKAVRTSTSSSTPTPSKTASDGKRGRGRPRKHPLQSEIPAASIEPAEEEQLHVPPTPTSPDNETDTPDAETPTIKDEPEENETPTQKRGKRGRPVKGTPKGTPKSATKVKEEMKSVTSRRMNNRHETFEVDEKAFKGFDYHMENLEQFTPERCHELEEVYWKTINYGTPMYGADMPGSLFDSSTESWNVAKLPNLLDVLGTNVPGVNTAYLYLGMWKATFAWHLEDVDLYSINYIHFGAPKQWYSISQEDARRFEAAMRTLWPNDSKHCDQFLRHKTYLISPEKLKSQFNITVNKLVHNEGEFVITYPYGYHSGFNLGYNCAESVNFATEQWLNYGRIAKKCNCESDSVWVDVYEIERKLRGEPTPEYYEVTEDEEDEDDRLPSPPPSGKKKPGRKRKRDDKGKDAAARKTKRIKIRVRAPAREPCILCPNDPKFDILLPTDNGKQAHRLCALYTPETYLVESNGIERVCNVSNIDRARLDLKCNYCRSKRGACFQCSSKKCARAYHATCAAAAGVQIDTGPVPTWDEEGTEYVCEGYDFRCRFHRPKRPKNTDSETLEKMAIIPEYGRKLKSGQVIQALYLEGDIFAGTVVKNKPDEMSCIVDVVPDGDRVEVEWKYMLVLDPADSLRPKPSPDAKPLPQHLLHQNDSVNANNRKDGVPTEGDPFHDPAAGQKWKEFHAALSTEIRNPAQVKVDINKAEHLWFYLGKSSTEARAQYTHDATSKYHNPKSNFLESVKPPPQPFIPRPSLPASYTTAYHSPISHQYPVQPRPEKPYVYKPRTPQQQHQHNLQHHLQYASQHPQFTTQQQQQQQHYRQQVHPNGNSHPNIFTGQPPYQRNEQFTPTSQAYASNPTALATARPAAYPSTPYTYQAAGPSPQGSLPPMPTGQSAPNQQYSAVGQSQNKSRPLASAAPLKEPSLASHNTGPTSVPPVDPNSVQKAKPQKLDNSPPYQNFYSQAERRYTSQHTQEYAKAAIGPVTTTQQAYAPTPSTSSAIPPSTPAPVVSAALASLRNLPSGNLSEIPSLARLPFTPPSKRPEMNETATTNDYLNLLQRNTYLRNAYLRRPTKYESPYRAVGPTDAPKPTTKPGPEPGDQSTTPAGSPRPKPASPATVAQSNAPQIPPAATENTPQQRVQYQTDEQFSAQVHSMSQQPAPGTPKFDAWIKRLLDQSTTSSAPLITGPSALRYHRNPTPPPRSEPASTSTPAQGSALDRSPERPDYSPISDAGR